MKHRKLDSNHSRTCFRTPYQGEEKMQDDRTVDSHTRQPSYRLAQVRRKKKMRKIKRKMQNIGKAPQHQIHRRKLRKPVLNSAKSKSVDANPSRSVTGPKKPPEKQPETA